MNSDLFERGVSRARARLAQLAHRADNLPPEARKLVDELLEVFANSEEELQVAAEELQVSADKLQRQNQELLDARREAEVQRRRYQDLFEFAPYGYLVTDPAGVIHEANQAAVDLLGVPRMGLIGKPLVLYVTADDRSQFHRQLDRLVQQVGASEHEDSIAAWEMRLQPRQGPTFPAALTVAPVQDAGGKLTGLLWLLRDVTERKKAEAQREAVLQALRESQASLEALIENTDGSIWSVDRDYRLIVGNSVFHRNIRATLGQSFAPGDSVLPDDFPPKVLDKWRGYYARVLGGERFSVEARRHFVKEPGFMEYRFNPIYAADGAVIGATVYGLDVTERKRVMEALRASGEELTLTLDATTDGIWKWDFESNELFFSSRYYTMLGYEPGEFPANYESWVKLIHPDDLRQALAVAEEYLATKPDNYENEFRLRPKSGDYRWIRTEARVVARDEEGKALRMIGNHRDVTERKEAEAQMQAALEALHESEVRNRAILNALPDLMFVYDRDGSYLDYHATELDALYTPPEQFLGENVGDILPAEAASILLEAIERAVASSEMQSCEYQLPIAGQGRDFEARVVPYGRDKTLSIVREITVRKRAESQKEAALDKVRKSEKKLRTLVENVVDWVWQVDKSGVYTYASPQAEELMGYPVAEIVGKTPFHFMAPEEAKRVGAIFSEAMAKRERIVGLEDTLLAKDGREVLFETNATPLFDQDGEFVGYMGTCRDTTERRRLAEALRESEERFRITVQRAPIGVGIVDSQGNLTECNAALAEMIGYRRKELIGVSFADFTHPKDLEREWELIHDLWAGQRTGYRMEKRYLHREGHEIWVDVVASLSNRGTDDPEFGFAFVQDITERKQAESQRRAALEALRHERNRAQKYLNLAGIMFVALDDRGNVTLINRKGSDILGYEQEEILGQNWFDTFLPTRKRDQVRTIFDQLMAGETEQAEYVESIILTKGGEERIIAWQNTVLADDQGQIVGTLSSGQDITERKRVEETLRESELKHRMLFEDALNPIMLVDPEGRYLDANRAAIDFLECEREELLTKNVWDFSPPELLGRQRQEHDPFVAPRTLETEYLVHGNVKTLLLNVIPLTISGQMILYGIGQDITSRKQAETALRRRTDQLEALRQIGMELTSELDTTTLLDSIVARAVELLESSVGGLYLYRPERDVLELVVATGLEPEMIGTELRPGEGVAGQIWESGEPLVVEDYNRWSDKAPAYENHAFTGVVGVPVRWREKSLGVLNVTTEEPRTFSAADAELLSLLASQAAIAIQNARFFEAESQAREEAETRAVELRKRERQLALLNAITLTALETRTVEAMLQILADRLAHLIDADGCYVTLWDEAQQRVIPAAASGPASDTYPALEVKDDEPTVTEAALRLGRPLAIEDVFDSPHANLRIASQLPARSLLGLPLIAGDQKLGAALIAFNEPHRFSREEILIGQQAARQISLALAKGRLLEQEREQRQLAETLRQVGATVNSSLDREKVLAVILEQLARVVSYDNASVMLVKGDTLELVAQRGFEKLEGLLPPMSVEELPHVQHVLKSRQAAVVPNVQADTRWRPAAAGQDVCCWLGVPLVNQGRAIGLLNLGHEQEAFYSQEDARVAEAFAVHAAIAIENTELFMQAKQAYEELKDTQAQLVQSAKLAAIGQLAAGVAHELNNPLTSVLGFAELVVRKLEPEDPNRRDLEIVAEEARRARHIVRNLLDFARQSESRKRRQDLNHLVRQTLTLTRIQLDKNGIEIEEHYNPDLDLVPLDAGQMRQVLLNLVTNAAQAMPEGGTLAVSTAQAGNEARVSIADTGKGIPEEIQDRIFEPFFTTKPSGTGLGLSVSLGIVQGHGGQIELDSRLGQGSTFIVSLPMTKQSEAETHVP